MDWGYKFNSLQEEIKTLQNKANALAESYAKAVEFTTCFLEQCENNNISMVSIGKMTKKVDGSIHFPFDPSGSVFADGIGEDGVPLIWRVVEKMGIAGGAGNDGQHQINCTAKLVDGVYELSGGKWRKIE